MTHRLRFDWKQRIQAAIPFGLGLAKPKHYRSLVRAVWKNRGSLRHAWRLLTRGICDGCALGAAGLRDWTVPGVHLCLKRLEQLRRHTMPALDVGRLTDAGALARLSKEQLADLGRLPSPLLRAQGEKGFRQVSWETALERLAERIRQSDPNRIGFFLGSGGLAGETYYMAQKVARYLGTNHVDYAARLSEGANAAVLEQALGVTEATCSFRDWIGTDLVVFFGANPARESPFAVEYLLEAKRRGTKVVMVHPRLEPGMSRVWLPARLRSALFGTAVADYWFPVTAGGEVAFLYGIIKVLLRRGWQNQDWIDRHTAGFAALRQSAEELDWATLEKESGLTWRSLEQFAELIRDASKAVLVWGTDLALRPHGDEAVAMILNLGLARGYVGRDQTGLMPMGTHQRALSATRLGACPHLFPGLKPVNQANAGVLERHYGFPVPAEPGWSVAQMSRGCAHGDLDLLYCVGGDFLAASSSREEGGRALARVPCRVHQDLVLTDQMLIEPEGEVWLLPAQNRFEQDDGATFFSAERRILFNPPILRPFDPIKEAKADWRILSELAAALHPDRALEWQSETGQAIRQEMAWIIPDYAGMQYLDKCGDALQCGGRHLCAGGEFAHADRRARFRTVPLRSMEESADLPSLSSHSGSVHVQENVQEKPPCLAKHAQ